MIRDKKGIWKMIMWIWIISSALALGIFAQGEPDWWYIFAGLPVVTGVIWGIAWLMRNNP